MVLSSFPQIVPFRLRSRIPLVGVGCVASSLSALQRTKRGTEEMISEVENRQRFLYLEIPSAFFFLFVRCSPLFHTRLRSAAYPSRPPLSRLHIQRATTKNKRKGKHTNAFPPFALHSPPPPPSKAEKPINRVHIGPSSRMHGRLTQIHIHILVV